jgi:hypothetical protein
MASLEDSQEREIVDDLERPLLRPVDRVRIHLLTLQLLLPREWDGLGCILVPLPVADPVGVAGPDQNGDSALDYLGELGEECAWV